MSSSFGDVDLATVAASTSQPNSRSTCLFNHPSLASLSVFITTNTPHQARDDKGAAAAMKEELKDVPPLAMMASEIKDEVYDDEDDTLDAGLLCCLCSVCV